MLAATSRRTVTPMPPATGSVRMGAATSADAMMGSWATAAQSATKRSSDATLSTTAGITPPAVSMMKRADTDAHATEQG